MSFWDRWKDLYARVAVWLKSRMLTERQRLPVITIVAGGVCGLVAVAFHLSVGRAEALMIERATALPSHLWIWAVILTPAFGGLAAGTGLYFFVPGAAGSGIPQVKVAYMTRSGYVSMKETIGKFALCVLQLGAGASLGVEGSRTW